jgi:hypothetical protein
MAMNGQLETRDSTLSLLLDWIRYLRAWRRSSIIPTYSANEIVFAAALSGSPSGF